MEKMRKEQCRQIRTRIFEHVAPAHFGKVSLNNAYRLFSHLGSLSEIERCLDEFLKNGLAKKVEAAQGKFYVFEEIALEFGRRWNEELADLREQNRELEKEVLVLRGELEAVEKMRDVWVDGWEDVLKDSDVYSSVNNYISSVFFGQYVKRVLGKLQERNRILRTVSKKIREIESKLRASYEDQKGR